MRVCVCNPYRGSVADNEFSVGQSKRVRSLREGLQDKRAKPQQAFIQPLLSTAVFPQRFGFFTVCLVQWLRKVAS